MGGLVQRRHRRRRDRHRLRRSRRHNPPADASGSSAGNDRNHGCSELPAASGTGSVTRWPAKLLTGAQARRDGTCKVMTLTGKDRHAGDRCQAADSLTEWSACPDLPLVTG
jgi:hypothetical protein